jgi:hypothetical protein
VDATIMVCGSIFLILKIGITTLMRKLHNFIRGFKNYIKNFMKTSTIWPSDIAREKNIRERQELG